MSSFFTWHIKLIHNIASEAMDPVLNTPEECVSLCNVRRQWIAMLHHHFDWLFIDLSPSLANAKRLPSKFHALLPIKDRNSALLMSSVVILFAIQKYLRRSVSIPFSLPQLCQTPLPQLKSLLIDLTLIASAATYYLNVGQLQSD